MALSWKCLARREWARLKRTMPAEVNDMVDAHYSGAGGCLHPSGAMRTDLAADDVAYEALACDCRATISEATRGS